MTSSVRIEVSRVAAATLRSLDRAGQQAVAERIAALAQLRVFEADAPLPGAFLVDAGERRLVCAWRAPDVVLVAAIETPGSGVTEAVAVSARALMGRITDLEPAEPRRSRELRGTEPRGRGMRAMDLLLEVRLAMRALRRDLGIVLLAVLVLGIGIGLPTAVFGLIDAAIRRGLPVPDGKRIVHLERRPHGASGEGWGVSAREVALWREQQRSLTGLEAFEGDEVTVRVGEGSWRSNATRATGGTFTLLGVPAAIGRMISEEDGRPGAPPVTVVSHAFWRDLLASDPAVIGRTIAVEGVPHTVIGVAPEDFAFPDRVDLYLPLSLEERLSSEPAATSLSAFGRLGPGIDLDEARAEFAVIAGRAEAEWPDANENIGIAVKPFTERMIGENPTAQMQVVLMAVLLVLVVACANVTNLLLVRAVRRMRDMAVRAALGATRGRLAVQALIESSVLAVAGGLAGVGVAGLVLGLFRRSFGFRLPPWAEFRLDGSALLFVAGLTAVAALLAGLIPALRTGAGDLSRTLRDETRGSTGTRVGRVMRGLVVLEMALSVALLTATGLLVRSSRQASPDRLGVPYANVLTGRVAVPEGTPTEDARLYYAALEREIAGQPGAERVTLATSLPTTRAGGTRFALDGIEYPEYDAQPVTRWVAVSNGFFDVWDAPPLRGRAFGTEDLAGPPVVIINQALAQRFFPNGDAVGERIRLGRPENEDWRTIVGVVPDLWAAGLDAPPSDRNPPAAYVPIAQASPGALSIAVRVAGGNPTSFVPALRAGASAIDPDVPLYDVLAMEDVITDHNWFYGMAAMIFALCGLATLVLATAGLYGVIAFSVSQRTREFGVRMAMGAEPGDILRMVVRNGAGQLVIGIAAGLLLATFIARGLSAMLFGVRPTDPLVLGGTTALLLAIAVAAMALPARRAARVDPLDALRAD